MADNQDNKSKRELFAERLKNKYPDREFADDEVLFGQIYDDYDEYDKELKGHRDNEKRLTDLFARDPRNARFLTDMARGIDPWIAMVERLGIDGITDIINDPERKEALAEANKRHVEQLAKSEELEKEYEKNLAESFNLFEQLQSERSLSDEDIDNAVDLIMKIANEAILGKFSRESLEMALKANSHDADVAAASAEAEIRGRNSRIEEKLRKPQKSDGTPSLAGANNAPRPKHSGSIFDLANQAR